MTELALNEFLRKLNEAVDHCAENHEAPKVSRSEGADFVVLSAEDWAAIEETLHLNRIPGLPESIHEVSKEPLEEGAFWRGWRRI